MDTLTLSENPTAGELLQYITLPTVLGALDEPTQQALQAELTLVRLAPNQTLFQQGDPGDSLYVLVQGQLLITLQNPDGSTTIIDEAKPYQVIGEMALLTGQTRSATVTALAASALVKLAKADFERLERHHPAIATRLAHSILPRLQQQQLLQILTRLFGDLDKSARFELQASLAWLYLAAGDCLIRQGDVSDALYIVVNGRLRVTLRPPESYPLENPTDAEEQFVREIGAGEMVGEIGLLTDSPRTATVTAIRGTIVVKLSQAVYTTLLMQHPQAMFQIARILATRQVGVQTTKAESPVATSFVLMAGDPATPLAEFAQRLYTMLAGFGDTLYLNHERFDQAFGKPGAAQTKPDDPLHLPISGWLSEQETRYRYIIYAADVDWSAWTQRCTQQADRILLVKQANGSPMLDSLEQVLAGQRTLARQELVLLQGEATTRPSGTAAWLQPRQVAAHYHVRMNNVGDWQRMARRLTERAIGLVLSGGGARGFAHSGVLRALLEAQIPIDIIGGVSAGALAGGAYALDLDYAQSLAFGRLLAAKKRVFDYTLPFTSMVAGAKLSGHLQRYFGETMIEDLWTPFFCVSCNLSRATLKLHEQGPLWTAIRASTAIPGIFAPMLQQGDVLVDGGIINNFPADLMRQQYQPGVVIGVNLRPPIDALQNYHFGASISGWQILWKRLNPFAKPLQAPSLMNILVRAADVHSVQSRRLTQGLVDLLILPDVKHVRADNYDAFDELREIGYRAACQALATWDKTKELTQALR